MPCLHVSLLQQLSHPTGLFGRLIRRLMDRHNAKMNAFALELLELTPADRVLEIGFGGGVTLSTLIERAGFVAGIDRSHVMAERAKARYAGVVAAGRAEFREGTVEALPFEAASFDKDMHGQQIYFWRSLEAVSPRFTACSRRVDVLSSASCRRSTWTGWGCRAISSPPVLPKTSWPHSRTKGSSTYAWSVRSRRRHGTSSSHAAESSMWCPTPNERCSSQALFRMRLRRNGCSVLAAELRR